MTKNYKKTFNFTCINRARKDIRGYKTNYKLTISFSLVRSNLDSKTKLFINKIIEDKLIKDISDIDLLSLMKNIDSNSFLNWIIQRLNKTFPVRNIMIQKIIISEEGKDEVVFNHTSTKNKQTEIFVKKTNLFIDDLNLDFSKLNLSKKLSYFKKIMGKLQLQNCFGQVNNFTSKSDWKNIENTLNNFKGGKIYICNFICPPYVNDKKLGYIGLFDSMADDPMKYNFDYDYIKNFKNLEKIVLLGNRLGIPLKGMLVFCDWGLINIDGIKTTINSDAEIILCLKRFKDSITSSLRNYSGLEVITLSELRVSEYLPLGLPYSYNERKKFLKETIKSNGKIFKIIDRNFLTQVLIWLNDQILIDFLNWRNFSKLDEWKNFKEDLVNILKTYENILWMKINKICSNPDRNIIYHEQHKDLREEAFYDALLRYVEYKIYGQLISSNFEKIICLYQDPGFPMAGQHFKNSKLPVMFIDPDSLKDRLKFDYSPFISYDNGHMENLKNMSSGPLEPKKKAEVKERYNPLEKERYWQDFWEREGVYQFNPEQPGSLFTIDTPPPTISGALHLGHIFSYTQAEIITRFKRMQGSNVRYSFGLDNNGLPTERLVEKETGIRGNTVGLEDFTKICLEVTDKYKHLYEDLWKSIGLSVDWRLEYSSISPEVQKIAQSTFKELYEMGVIYKKNAPALYCTECHTSFAQAEKEDKEKEAVFYDLAFKTEDGRELIIATTRPELLPACSAVFVHPDDPRFKDLVGKKVTTPLGHEVEIMTDEKVEKEKGTGAVMCCTYGDETDIYWAKKYNLPEKIIFSRDGKLQKVEEIPELEGKTIKEAREIIVARLRNDGIVRKEDHIKHNVDVHERCGTPVEFLPTTQWFVKILDMKEKKLEAGNKIKWHPEHMKKRYEDWINGLKWDWCISRERFYGIPIPVFNCDKCDNIIIPSVDEMPIDPKKEKDIQDCPVCKIGKMMPEKSVLDTWFTSALSPEINNSHPLNGKLNGEMYPMSMRPQAHDIIRTWAVYSILMSLYKHNDIPWKNLMISGHILVQKGEKISKKTGGGKYKPEELINQKSADAVRYAMSGSSLGKDTYFDEKEVEKGRKLVTKLYNAGKLVLSKLKNFDSKMEVSNDDLEAIDQWILNRSVETAQKMAEAFENYEYSQARQIFEDFFWREFCDNYLEIDKKRLSIESSTDKLKISAQYACYHSFLNILKMVSPFVPHITEEMFHANVITKQDGENTTESVKSDAGSGYYSQNEGAKSIHNTAWPSQEAKYTDERIKERADFVLSVIAEIRKYKSDNKIKLSTPISVLKIKCSEEQKEKLTGFLDDLASLARAEKIETETTDSKEIGIEIIL